MGSNQKPHVVCMPYPAQGHVNPMLKLAKLLHHKGFHITFVHSEYNYKRLIKSRGPNSLEGLPDFQFETIPDGLPPTNDIDSTQDIPSLCISTSTTCILPFRKLLGKLNDASLLAENNVPPVSCILADGVMSFSVEAAKEIGVPCVLLWTASACSLYCYAQYRNLVERGIVPLKDASYLTNGHLDETVPDWIPGLNDIRLRDFPTFIRTTDPNDVMLNYAINEIERVRKASAIILNTFDALEQQVIDSLSLSFPPIFTLGPLHLLIDNQIPKNSILNTIGTNLWKEEPECIQWLNSQKPSSVVYVNFGSIVVMSPQQLVEFAWGLANSQQSFLWMIRPDLVVGESAILSPEFTEETKDRGLMATWCPQEQVLNHEAIGGFLTHNGWNSTIESISGGVTMVCWPFFADQQTNCRYACNEWGIGIEIDNNVKRNEVETLVRELINGDKGKLMKIKAMEWKKLAEDAAAGPHGSSWLNFDKVVKEALR